MNFKQKKQAGFTLIELVIVVVILGILALVVSRQFGGNVSNGAKANALYEASNKLTQNWALLAQQAGTSTTVASSPLVLTGKVPEDILVAGSAYIATAYQGAWTQGGLIPLTDLAQGTAGGGVYTIASYPFSIAGGGASPLSVTFNNVPDELVVQVVQKHGSGVATLAASDSANAVVQYGTATGGLRTMTVFKPI
jgi:prepilin-type N-terminal cleavage/methylation domain-containing protein